MKFSTLAVLTAPVHTPSMTVEKPYLVKDKDPSSNDDKYSLCVPRPRMNESPATPQPLGADLDGTNDEVRSLPSCPDGDPGISGHRGRRQDDGDQSTSSHEISGPRQVLRP